MISAVSQESLISQHQQHSTNPFDLNKTNNGREEDQRNLMNTYENNEEGSATNSSTGTEESEEETEKEHNIKANSKKDESNNFLGHSSAWDFGCTFPSCENNNDKNHTHNDASMRHQHHNPEKREDDDLAEAFPSQALLDCSGSSKSNQSDAWNLNSFSQNFNTEKKGHGHDGQCTEKGKDHHHKHHRYHHHQQQQPDEHRSTEDSEGKHSADKGRRKPPSRTKSENTRKLSRDRPSTSPVPRSTIRRIKSVDDDTAAMEPHEQEQRRICSGQRKRSPTSTTRKPSRSNVRRTKSSDGTWSDRHHHYEDATKRISDGNYRKGKLFEGLPMKKPTPVKREASKSSEDGNKQESKASTRPSNLKRTISEPRANGLAYMRRMRSVSRGLSDDTADGKDSAVFDAKESKKREPSRRILLDKIDVEVDAKDGEEAEEELLPRKSSVGDRLSGRSPSRRNICRQGSTRGLSRNKSEGSALQSMRQSLADKPCKAATPVQRTLSRASSGRTLTKPILRRNDSEGSALHTMRRTRENPPERSDSEGGSSKVSGRRKRSPTRPRESSPNESRAGQTEAKVSADSSEQKPTLNEKTTLVEANDHKTAGPRGHRSLRVSPTRSTSGEKTKRKDENPDLARISTIPKPVLSRGETVGSRKKHSRRDPASLNRRSPSPKNTNNENRNDPSSIDSVPAPALQRAVSVGNSSLGEGPGHLNSNSELRPVSSSSPMKDLSLGGSRSHQASKESLLEQKNTDTEPESRGDKAHRERKKIRKTRSIEDDSNGRHRRVSPHDKSPSNSERRVRRTHSRDSSSPAGSNRPIRGGDRRSSRDVGAVRGQRNRTQNHHNIARNQYANAIKHYEEEIQLEEQKLEISFEPEPEVAEETTEEEPSSDEPGKKNKLLAFATKTAKTAAKTVKNTTQTAAKTGVNIASSTAKTAVMVLKASTHHKRTEEPNHAQSLSDLAHGFLGESSSEFGSDDDFALPDEDEGLSARP